ncbi:protein kinase domain-containing protein [Roseateles sp.]|uniref:protein kinase domain-containing protein n=1 Tax=Roseateles sp. TaxID=1971397 RepID=UPI003D0E186C
MAEIDKARWARLSPLLDELLDLAPEQRPARLQALRQQAELGPELSTDLIEDLAELLRRQEALEAEDFLASPALSVAEAASAHNQAGQTVGAYTLEREIGQGGMGTVWLARRTDGRFEGQVAIKFLTTGLLGRGDAGRFAREGQILARLTHPHIARLLDAGVAPEHQQPYLVLEYIDGLPLDRFCVERALDCEARVRLFLDVLVAVAHAHTRLILHRDLKPSNILVTATGEVKLLDFGIAKLLNRATDDDTTPPGAATELTRLAGRAYTPRYAAPEQVQGGEVTTATDVYALGVLLYLLLSGQHPTEGRDEAQTTPLERLRTLVEVEPKKVSERVPSGVARQLRGDLDTIVAKALKKAPAERYANAAALAEDLKRWLAHEPISARPDRRAYIVGKFIRRHRLAVAASCAALLAIAAGAGAAVWKAQEAHEQRVQAEGLIEFMLGDLRKKLDPVGRLDVLDAVGAKALAYYARQPLTRMDAESLGRRAKALHLMGEIADKRGHKADALAHFSEAARSTGELLARAPGSPQLMFNHGQSVYWMGYAAREEGRQAEAQQQFERYLALSEQLASKEPDQLDWQVELAYAHNNLGILLLESGQPAAALPRFEAAAAIWRRHQSERSSMASELSTSLGWMAKAQEDLGLLDESIRSHQAKLKLLPVGEATGASAESRAASFTTLGRLHLNAGRGEQSLQYALDALKAYLALSQLDPDNLDLVQALCFARIQVIETALAIGQNERVKSELHSAGLELQRLLAADKSKPARALRLQGRWLTARTQQAHPSPEQARSARAALAAFLQGYPAPNPAKPESDRDAPSRLVLAAAALQLGDAWARDDVLQARAAWHSVLQHLLPSGEANPDPRVNCLRAKAAQRLGQTQVAQALVERIISSTSFRHPAWMADLSPMRQN